MKSKMMLVVAAMALSLGLVSAPASWANSLPFQGVTFNLTDNGVGTLNFQILNAVSGGTGDWANINYINAFSLKNTSATNMSLTGWSVTNLELNNAGGCAGGNPSGAEFCFTYDTTLPLTPLALTDNMTFNIAYTGQLNMSAPHLKVFFMNEADQVKCVGQPKVCYPVKSGSLLSQDIPGERVPEPVSLLLLGAGLAGIGIWRRKLA